MGFSGFHYGHSLTFCQYTIYLFFVPTPRKVTDQNAQVLTSGIPARLAELRRERGLTQAELAQAVGITRKLIANYEAGRTHLNDESIILLAKVLGVSTDQLLGVAQNPAAESVQSIRLVRRMQKIEKMPAPDQKALLKTIDKYLGDLPSES
jgi:transcriptional regulator with XRE-family HTH domain